MKSRLVDLDMHAPFSLATQKRKASRFSKPQDRDFGLLPREIPGGAETPWNLSSTFGIIYFELQDFLSKNGVVRCPVKR
jgi:hypothetical protein